MSEATARTAFENTPRSSRRLAPLFAPGSQAYTGGSQASTPMRASYLTADEEGDRNDSPSYGSRRMARNVSRQEVGTRDTLQIVRKWGVTFSGKRDSSAEEFLTRVREFRRGSPLSDDEMLGALPFLLADKALQWHRLHEDIFTSWQDFAQAFRRRFGGVNFQTRIRDEARKRTQGTDESLADFLMNIRLISKHLDPPYSMAEEMKLVYNNLHPRYRANIGREEFDSFSELERLDELSVASQAMSRTYVPPPSPEESLLPKLAYQLKARSSSWMAATEDEVSQYGKASLKSEGVPKRKTKGFDERMFITIKIRGQNVEALFDPGSCRTYLGGQALEKFPGMLTQAEKGKKFKVVYPNGNVEETGGSLFMCMGIDGGNETIEARVAPSFEYECVFVLRPEQKARVVWILDVR